ncbi:MAG: hypothetical protein A3I88_01535 [Candidatus Portnoybacteria bacterium RIFCSPLOWO2_12_FULL_39_9]|uniref:Peptidase M19 n=1 Tax=Candidatus Portnoybacteria bacterium RIFCSPHIGHO2_12_FULL_38_9 TaxID=1801997 RepID=A0A1G2FFP8_9BACT|nr:MAG: hypothetical protein A2646_02075 [Candidatus Portnoybacteria bacterium RIFCSPHIGHO2_02_FULL_39_12]OGZ36894.1 MAG: hypothetical protein A3J64_03615 [Candidatus Portnoybacteria bacterium RIFCSPHIGHO2_12_FULL_38_9]OGZ40576.1 MAG: hypothetical protein A3I88_01535 [Candidatus Portnoybacteria bacterium RIFCSPLOWO2_12_FULL_39_9]
MSEREKISSLHDDFEMPLADKGIPEYDIEKGYPQRHKDIGEKGEKSVINRIYQFGIKEEDLRNLGIINPTEITEKQYSRLIKEAVEKQYDTLFASVFGHWSEIEKPQKQLTLIKRVSRMYRNWGMNLIKKGEQISEREPNLVIALEGADFVRNLGDIDKIYDQGIRSVTIQYGKENALANDVGLTPLGRQAITKMFDLGIIIDIAHANSNVRKSILDLTEDLNKGQLVAYTHGATSEDIAQDIQFSAAAEKRGLSKEEVERIVKLGGIIGLGVSKPFFQSIDKIAERIDQICQIENGPKSLGLGTDFGGVAPVWEIGISKPEDIAKLGDTLSRKFGYSDGQIKNILQKNVHNWVANALI